MGRDGSCASHRVRSTAQPRRWLAKTAHAGPRPDGTAAGNNWLRKGRDAETPRVYITDDRSGGRPINYDDLFVGWEQLRFEIGGKDAE